MWIFPFTTFELHKNRDLSITQRIIVVGQRLGIITLLPKGDNASPIAFLPNVCETNPRGVLRCKRYTGMCRGHDPLFSGQSALPRPSLPIYNQCAAHVPPPPHFQFLEKKNCIFSLVLAKISALKTQIFQIFVPNNWTSAFGMCLQRETKR